MDKDDDETKSAEVITLRTGKQDTRTYETTLINNSRRFGAQTCPHKGPYIVDRKLATVECQDCGALLNPIYVLEMLACQEAYWNLRQRELRQYLDEINAEIEGRTRTRCVHCQNMTPIKFKRELPRTWVPQPY